MSNSVSGPGYAILTDPHQKKEGYFRVLKTNNIITSFNQMNLARAKRDVELIGFFPCSDLAKVEALVKPALKNKLINQNSDWVKCEDEKGIEKLKVTIETLVDIGNES